jgi:hypothetical protein
MTIFVIHSYARHALEDNITTTVLDGLNSTSGELFQVFSRRFDTAHVDAKTRI